MSDENSFPSQVDVIVVGAGAGGLFAGALLAHHGYRTLIVERFDRVGGRASTRYLDGFAVNTGALAIEVGTDTEAIFKEIGAKLELRFVDPGMVCRLNGKDVNMASGLSRLVITITLSVLRVAILRLKLFSPSASESTSDWVSRFTKNALAHSFLRNFVGGVFAASPDQLPAAVFLHYFLTKSAFRLIGFPVNGTVNVWNALLESFTGKGGRIWLNSEVLRLTFDENKLVNSAIIRRDGKEFVVSSRITVSDIGPLATLELCGSGNLPKDYIDTVRNKSEPSAIISIYFASQTELVTFPGIASFAGTRRLSYAANCTSHSPQSAPHGWYLYVGASIPQPAVGEFDEAAEIDLLKTDLGEQFPGFETARIVDIVVTRGEWPAQRAVAGFDLPHTTPIANLWNVGDGVKEWANAGTTACAETARIVVNGIRTLYPVTGGTNPAVNRP